MLDLDDPNVCMVSITYPLIDQITLAAAFAGILDSDPNVQLQSLITIQDAFSNAGIESALLIGQAITALKSGTFPHIGDVERVNLLGHSAE